jgi:hypothetical protein
MDRQRNPQIDVRKPDAYDWSGPGAAEDRAHQSRLQHAPLRLAARSAPARMRAKGGGRVASPLPTTEIRSRSARPKWERDPRPTFSTPYTTKK